MAMGNASMTKILGKCDSPTMRAGIAFLFLCLYPWGNSLHAQVLAHPTLLDPPNNSTGQPVSVVLKWAPMSGATTYHVQVSDSATFSSTIYDNPSATATSVQIGSLARNSTYYWRVQGIIVSVTSAWSDTWNFTTIPPAPPPVPDLASPQNGALNQPLQ